MIEFKGTTICAVKKDGQTAIAGDGQVTMSESVIFKNNAVKVRRIYDGKVICQKCNSKYTFYKNNLGENIWFNRLRRKCCYGRKRYTKG